MPFDPSAARSSAIFSDNPDYAVSWIVYVNGIEIPTEGFNLSYGVWEIPQFSIHVLPDVQLQRLGAEDRVQVAIFYLDYWVDPRKPEFRLLCDGEIVGWSWSNVTGNRTMAFQCIAHAHIFKQLYFFYMTNVDDVVAAQSPEIRSAGLTPGTGLLYPYALFHQGLIVSDTQLKELQTPANGGTPSSPGQSNAQSPTAGTDADDAAQAAAPIQAPYELVYNVIKGVISKQVPNERRAVPMMNFFARWMRLTRFYNRWVRLPVFEDSDRLANRQGCFPIFNAARNDQALLAMQRQSAQISNSGPVWNTLTQLYNYVMMEIAMIPNPACVRVALSQINGHPQDGKILGLLEPTTALIEQRPNDQNPNTSFEQRANALAEQIRAAVQGNLTIPSSILEEAGFSSTPSSVEEIDLVTITTNLRRRAALVQESGEIGPPEAPAPPPDVGVEPLQPVRLAQYFVKPQFLFGIPPHCNVVFPSMIDGWSGDENYINQPTRVYINDSVMSRLLRKDNGANHEFMLHALTVGWPEEANDIMHHHVASSAQGQPQAGAPGAADSGRNILIWPEENFKGVVTGRMEMSSWLQSLLQFHNANANSTNDEDPPSNAPNSPARAVNNVNADISPTAPIPVIPGTTTAQTVQAAVTVPSDPSAPTSGTGQNTQTIARRIVVGRATRVSLNGAEPVRFWMGRFSLDLEGHGNHRSFEGLMPEDYLSLARTHLWPVANGPSRRGRSNPDTLPVIEKLNRLHLLLTEAVRSQIQGSFTESQLFAITFGFLWNAFTEGAANIMWNWGFGNQKQYSTSTRGPWTVQPDHQPYIAAGSKEDGARRFVARNLSGFGSSVSILTGEQPRNAVLRNFLAEKFIPEDENFWKRLGAYPCRPDFFYVSLGFDGYYNSEGGNTNAIENRIRRANIGKSRTSLIKRYYQNLVTHRQSRNSSIAHSVDDLQEFVIAWPHRPLIAQEDLAFLQQQGAGTPQNTRVVTRPAHRISVASVTPETAGTNGTPATTRATVDNTTGTTQVNRPNATENAASVDVTEADTEQASEPFAKLFKIYAQYEYFRQRYYERQAGATLRFNPYIVPGFPGIIFDSMRTRFHAVGYVQHITHAGVASNPPQLGTQVSYVCLRTFPEFLNDIRHDAEMFGARVTAAPAEIIPEIREIIQDEAQAEIVYQRLFHGGARPNNLPAAFHWDQAMGYARGLDVLPISIVGESVATMVARDRGTTTTTTTQETNAPPTSVETAADQRTVEHNINPNEALSPLPNIYQDCFDSYHIAMQMCARPVCTLEQYIRFLHGGRTVGDLMGEDPPIVSGELKDYSYAKVQNQDVVALGTNADGTRRTIRGVAEREPAVYYERIFRLRIGPGTSDNSNYPPRMTPTTNDERGYGDGPPFNSSPVSKGVPASYPQTRDDWDSVLTAYARKVRLLLRPST